MEFPQHKKLFKVGNSWATVVPMSWIDLHQVNAEKDEVELSIDRKNNYALTIQPVKKRGDNYYVKKNKVQQGTYF